MTLHARDWFAIPEQTAQVAQAAFPKGNVYMTMRDELGLWYKDSDFAHLFVPHQGRPAESPGGLALVTVMQFAEGLSDRQAAEAVRARIDWKYALGLPLEDPGFHYSVLSEFRDRVIAGGAEDELLNTMLERFKGKGLLKARGRQRTDSTHVLAAIRQLNRLECVGETLRAALNALATVVPEWLQAQVAPDWFDRYGSRFEQYRLPKEKAERQQLAEVIGADGHQLMSAVYGESAPPWLREIPAVEALRQVWVQQYTLQEGMIVWRSPRDLPPHKALIVSPYDVEARNRTKRSLNWTGYAVHLTETCDEDSPNLIVHVETTPAATGDVEMTEPIHAGLAEKGLLPSEHFVDTGYVDADLLVTSRTEYGVDLHGRAQLDGSWQTKSPSAFDVTCFAIDWEAGMVTCPEGQVARFGRRPRKNGAGSRIQARFSPGACRACRSRCRCTRSKESGRTVTLKLQAQHLALQAARQRQVTAEFKQEQKVRAGVEGTISQGTRSFDLRRSRYIGLSKTHLQHVATVAAMNLTRAVSWVRGFPKASTRLSSFAALAPVAT